MENNEVLRESEKEADINNYKSFYWCECSDSIERYYDKFDGFLIPNIYARDIIEQVDKSKGQLISSLDEDGYHYKIYSKEMDKMLIKKIYGFNSPETFNKVIENQEYGFREWENKIKNKLNESAFDSYSVVDAAFELVDIFSVEFEYGCREFPPYAMNLMKKYMDLLYNEIHSDHYYSRYSKTKMEDTYEVGMSYLEIFDTLVLYKFE